VTAWSPSHPQISYKQTAKVESLSHEYHYVTSFVAKKWHGNTLMSHYGMLK